MNCFQYGYTSDIAQREEIYKDRNRRIEEVCNKYKTFYKSPAQGEFFLFDLSHNLAVCLNPKVENYIFTDENVLLHLIVFQVGTTTWKRNLLLLSNMTPKQKMSLNTLDQIHGKVRKNLLIPNQV